MFLLEPGPSPPRGGGSGFVNTRGGLTFLITGEGTATFNSFSIDLVSSWLCSCLYCICVILISVPPTSLTPGMLQKRDGPRL